MHLRNNHCTSSVKLVLPALLWVHQEPVTVGIRGAVGSF